MNKDVEVGDVFWRVLVRGDEVKLDKLTVISTRRSSFWFVAEGSESGPEVYVDYDYLGCDVFPTPGDALMKFIDREDAIADRHMVLANEGSRLLAELEGL